MTNGLSRPYHLDESIFILGDLGVIFHFYFIIAASHLGLFCLPMSHKKDARLIWVKISLWVDSHFILSIHMIYSYIVYIHLAG